MRVESFTDLGQFLVRAGPFLSRDEARHNLQLGILSMLRDHPEVYPEFRLWLAEDRAGVACTALRTPPYNLALARPRNSLAIEALVEHLVTEGEEIPGVTAAEPEADLFASAWEGRTGARGTGRFRQGIYRLTDPNPVPEAPGVARAATQEDRSLLDRWVEDFLTETLPHEPIGPARRRTLDARLASGDDGGLWLLEEGDVPVCLVGYGGSTPNGIRVGPVYTPKAFRRRGFATKLVSQVSTHLLARGRRFCFLYTDLTNPTSNAIYRRIGYEHVCDSADIRFG